MAEQAKACTPTQQPANALSLVGVQALACFRRRCVAIVFFIVSLQAVFSSSDFAAAFDQANRMYEQGKFAESANAYEALIKKGHRSAALYYNLGNAFFKAGQNGRSIVAYRQAQKLAPRDPNIRFNLQFVRKRITGFETEHETWWQRWLANLTLNEWTVIAVAAYWVWCALLALRELRPRLRTVLRGYTATAGLMFAVFTACLVSAANQSLTVTEAVVVVPNAVVRRGPLEESPVSYQLPDGSEVQVLDQKELQIGDKKQLWLQVRDSRGIGWLQSDQVVRIDPPMRKLA